LCLIMKMAQWNPLKTDKNNGEGEWGEERAIDRVNQIKVQYEGGWGKSNRGG
jgi:hypothetical protein